MKRYNYDFEGYFTGESEAVESPLEPGVFLLAAYSTFEVPPAQEDGYALRWVNGGWINELLPVLPIPPIPTEEELIATAWIVLRSERDALLRNSDFTQLADAPISVEQKAAWVVYRQALRDLPANTVDPRTAPWPTMPA